MPRLAARATPVRALTYQPALAGFRPAAAAIAVATAFALPVTLRAQPVGGQAVAGQASFVRNGANLLVTTQNAAGSNHSAINWQSFSVPLGSVTQFNQPSATSTSINRVLGSDPSSIFGTLSSNGRLVLVNPAGIAVGKGAVVDTAGFTASTLPMSEADAIAGRLRFAGNGGSLQVDGSIVARSGDVVLIAPSVQAGTDAVVQSSGATVLAAGQKVEITGRGLEGIHLEVQAPGNQAVNLGTLKGDAVGIFAGTLKHSGLVQAQAVTSEGGKVLLKAQGDNLVSGAVQGRSIDVLGERVGLLAGAAVDASGAQGGGQVRIGGDYQGKNPDVPNAKRTYVDAQATIKADATEAGNGGRVIVWSDEATRMQGRISARGGAQGGDGGFVEVSGKQYLEFAGRADTRAPQGKAGMLLLDPNDIEINATGPTDTANAGGGEFSGGSGTSFVKDADLSAQLELGNVLVTTTPGSLGPLGGQITLAGGANVNWTAGTWLALQADKGIQLDGVVTGYGLSLHAMDGGIVGTGPLRVSQLYANAIAGSSTDPNAGKVLLTGANLVGTVAGHADRAFTFTNGGALSVGYVSSSNGYGDGINSSGPVSVTTAGDLTVESESSTSGNTVSLVSNGGSVYLGGSADVSASGRLDIRAATDVTAGGYVYISAGGGAAGGIHINAGTGNVDFGSSGFSLNSYQSPIEVTAGNSIVSSGVSYNSYGTVDGWIQLTASGGSISYGNIYASGSSGSFSVTDGGKVTLRGRTGVSGGDIASTGGSLYTSAGSGASGGEVFVESAEGSVQVGSVSTYGGSASSSSLGIGMGGTGGNVTLQSLATTPATVTAAYVSARGGNGYGDKGGTGGTVTVKAPGDIQLVNVDAGGGDGSTSASVPVAAAGAGGTIEVTSANGNITFGQKSGSSITVYGGAMVVGGYGGLVATGGAGGKIALSAPAGSIEVPGDLDASGGNSDSGKGGDARYSSPPAAPLFAIAVNSGGSVNIGGGLYASGGNSYYGSGGHGGAVAVESTGAISIYTANVRGGNASYGSASGGTGGNLLLSSAGAISSSSYIDVSGGAGETGGDGGTATLRGTDISASVYALGGEDYYSLTTGPGKGGHGGTIVVDVSGTLASWTTFDASGGPGRNGTPDALNGTPGGDGGAVQLTQVGTGDLNMSGVTLRAAGGVGGDAYIDGGAGLGGMGGSGGSVTAAASGGSMSIYSGALSATAGTGGYNADDSTRAAYGTLPGTVTIRAAGNIDLSGGDLSSLDHASFVAQAGGNIDSWQWIMGSGSPVTFSAGDATVSAAPNPAAALALHAPIATVDPDTGVGGALALSASGSVVIDVQPPPSFAFASSISPIVAGPVTITAPQVTVVAGNQVLGLDGVAIKADSIDLSGAVNAAAGTLSIDALGAGRTIRVGGTDETGSLNLTQLELDQLTAGTVIIGNPANTGSLVVETPIAFNRDQVDSLRLLTGADLQLAGTITANPASSGPLTADAVVLAANSINVGPSGGISVSDGRWLTYIAGPLASSNFGTLASGERALWNRTYAGSPPGTVTETGNRYLFAFQPTITIDATSQSKVYDGTAISSGGFTASPVIDASSYGNVWLQDPDPVISVKVASPGKNVGSYAIVEDSVTVPDGYAYVFNNGVATITPRALSVSATAANKVYDGTTAATVTGFADDRVAGDLLTFSASGANFDTKNVGTAKPVTISGISVAGTDAGNYTLANSTASTAADITARALVVMASAANKVYDGTTAATVTGFSDDRVAGDVLTVSSTAAAFDNKNVGTAKPVTVNGVTLAGTDAGNYVVAGSTTTSADITPRTLTVTATAADKVYDGTTAAVVTGLMDDRIAGDVLTLSSAGANFNTRNVGTAKPVTVGGLAKAGTDAGNYVLASSTAAASASITARMLTVSGTAANKVYDGTTAATVSGLTDDRVAGDVLTLSAAGASFANKNVGTAKPVTISGIAVGGADAGNYLLAASTAGTAADITARTLVVSATAANKVYDGTTAATLTGLADDRVAGDVLTLSAAGASFSDKNAGTGKMVTASGVAVGGTDAGNYILASASASGTADITRRPLSVAVSAQNKEYDATTAATVTSSDNRVAGDSVSVGVGSANFADKNAGSGKAVSASGISLSGADAGNYALANTSASSSADITPAAVTVTADNLVKAQGMELLFAGTEFSASGLKGGESITSVSLASPGAASAAPVGAYAITPSAAVGGNGFLAGNYTVSYLNGALAVFSPAQQPEINGPVATFATLFIEQARAQDALDKKKTDIGKDDIVVTDTQCKP